MTSGPIVHEAAIVDPGAEIGEGTHVWAFTHVMEGARIGRDCNIGEHCFIETGAVIEDEVTVKNGTMIWNGVTIERGAFIGPSVLFTNDRYPRSARFESASRSGPEGSWLVRTQVGSGASLGAGAVIAPGVSIGAFAMVAAGSVVTKDIAPHVLVRGAPAGPSGWVCACGLPLNPADRASCSECKRAYRRAGEGLEEDDDRS